MRELHTVGGVVVPITVNLSCDAFYFPRATRRAAPERVCQIEITGTISASVQGRCSTSASWAEVWTSAVTAAKFIAVFPEMRLLTTGAAGGTAQVWLDSET